MRLHNRKKTAQTEGKYSHCKRFLLMNEKDPSSGIWKNQDNLEMTQSFTNTLK